MLGQVNAIVEHLVNSWAALLRQRQYMQTLNDSPALSAALEETYAAHVHNAIGNVLLVDLLRAVGALVLDRDDRSASVANAVRVLEDEATLQALRAEMIHRVQPGAFVDAAAADSLRRHMSSDTEANAFYRDARADLDWVDSQVLNSAIAQTLRTVRNKAVAHNAVVRDGTDWKLWRIEGLTYGQLDSFIDTCTEAVDRLAHLALRRSHAFDLEPEHAKQWATEYVNALVAGLNQQRR